jgi:RHS repeat-associated protein
MVNPSAQTVVTTAYTYNPAGLLTGLANTSGVGATLSQVSGITYDGQMNLTSMTSLVGSNSMNALFGYDSKNRLVSETRNAVTNAFAYDNAGNPTTFKGATHAYNLNNQLTDSGYGYDGNGNPTTYSGFAATYDAANRLTSYKGVTFGYREDNLRAWKQNAVSKTYYYYDGGTPIFETDATGTLTATNVFAPDGLVARQQGGSWIYYAFDQQGNVAQRLDASGSELSESSFDAYGSEASTNSPSDPFGYNGQWGYIEDRDTGLYYCQNRYYDPSQGRWLTRDPIGFGGGLNVYGYCYSGPLMMLDNFGLEITFVGSDDGVSIFEPGGEQTYHSMSKEDIIQMLIKTDETDIDFWGHGSPGDPSINSKGDSLTVSDWNRISQGRLGSGKKKFSSVSFHECWVVSDGDYDNAILQTSDSVQGFLGWSFNRNTLSPGRWYKFTKKRPSKIIKDDRSHYWWGPKVNDGKDKKKNKK